MYRHIMWLPATFIYIIVLSHLLIQMCCVQLRSINISQMYNYQNFQTKYGSDSFMFLECDYDS